MDNKLEVLKRIALVSNEMPDLPKSKKGYNYKYTPLDDIERALKPLLTKHKLYKIHKTIIKGGLNCLQTVIGCLDNDSVIISELILDKDVVLAKMNKIQSLGSQITYYRRYHISAIFNLVSEEDNDGSAKNSNDKTIAKGDGTDYLSMFTKLLSKQDITIDKVSRHLSNYKSKMDVATYEQIKKLVEGKLGSLPF